MHTYPDMSRKRTRISLGFFLFNFLIIFIHKKEVRKWTHISFGAKSFIIRPWAFDIHLASMLHHNFITHSLQRSSLRFMFLCFWLIQFSFSDRVRNCSDLQSVASVMPSSWGSHRQFPSFGDNFNSGGHRFGSLKVLGSAGVRPLVHIPHLIHLENGLKLLPRCFSADRDRRLLCVKRPPDLHPGQKKKNSIQQKLWTKIQT